MAQHSAIRHFRWRHVVEESLQLSPLRMRPTAASKESFLGTASIRSGESCRRGRGVLCGARWDERGVYRVILADLPLSMRNHVMRTFVNA